jgi:hypothetical protein
MSNPPFDPTKTAPLPPLRPPPLPDRGQVVSRNGVKETNAAAGEIRIPRELQAARRTRSYDLPRGR